MVNDEKLCVLDQFRAERKMKYGGGLYRLTQVDFAYNSNHMEGSALTEDETRLIYETGRICAENGEAVSVNDIIETVNHFRCFDYLLDIAEEPLSEIHIKEFHRLLKSGSADERELSFIVGEYKERENIVGNTETTSPDKVPQAMRNLLESYNHASETLPVIYDDMRLQSIIDFHVNFEKIHPFQDGNGRVGRLIMFKECLHRAVMPFVIEDKNRIFYLRGIMNYHGDRTQLVETVKHEQEIFKARYDKYAFPAEKKVGLIRSNEQNLRGEAKVTHSVLCKDNDTER